MATGLLLVCLGPACRRSEELMANRKTYEARVAFGVATTTDDAEGELLAEAMVPPEVSDEGFALGLLARFEGEQEQIPPQVSAIKKNGVAAYRRFRRGEEVLCEPRRVVIYRLRLLRAPSPQAKPPEWEFEAEVSKGTYLRSLARDIGEAAGTRAHLRALRRTSIGAWTLKDAYRLEELEQREGIDGIAGLLR
jgi:tRNA pseudouridine55 synthase